jgi:hypothetical protein
MQAHNKALQPTPLRVERDRAVLKVRFGYMLVSIYQGGAVKRQAVRRCSDPPMEGIFTMPVDLEPRRSTIGYHTQFE